MKKKMRRKRCVMMEKLGKCMYVRCARARDAQLNRKIYRKKNRKKENMMNLTLGSQPASQPHTNTKHSSQSFILWNVELGGRRRHRAAVVRTARCNKRKVKFVRKYNNLLIPTDGFSCVCVYMCECECAKRTMWTQVVCIEEKKCWCRCMAWGMGRQPTH